MSRSDLIHSLRTHLMNRRLRLCGMLGVAWLGAACGGADSRAGAASGTAPSPADVLVAGVRSDSGMLVAVLCTKEEQFPNECALRATAPAKKGVVAMRFPSVKGGRYAFAVFHDANGDGRIGVSAAGLPSEGLGFSNDAMGSSGPPTFDASAFDVQATTKVAVRLRYW